MGRRFLLRYLNDGKVELGLDAALQASRVVKEEVVSFCHEYMYPMEVLTKHAVKASAKGNDRKIGCHDHYQRRYQTGHTSGHYTGHKSCRQKYHQNSC